MPTQNSDLPLKSRPLPLLSAGRGRAAAAVMVALIASLAPHQLRAQRALQSEGPSDPLVIRVVPSILLSPTYTRTEHRTVRLEDGSVSGTFARRVGAGLGIATEVEIPIAGPFRLSPAVAILHRQPGEESRTDGGASTAIGGGLQVVTRLGLALSVSERSPALQVRAVSATIFVGPAYVLEVPHQDRLSGEREPPTGAWALAGGLGLEVPLGRSGGLRIAAENHLVHWDQEEIARRLDRSLADAGLAAASSVITEATLLWSLRAGLVLVVR